MAGGWGLKVDWLTELPNKLVPDSTPPKLNQQCISSFARLRWVHWLILRLTPYVVSERASVKRRRRRPANVNLFRKEFVCCWTEKKWKMKVIFVFIHLLFFSRQLWPVCLSCAIIALPHRFSILLSFPLPLSKNNCLSVCRIVAVFI